MTPATVKALADQVAANVMASPTAAKMLAVTPFTAKNVEMTFYKLFNATNPKQQRATVTDTAFWTDKVIDTFESRLAAFTK